MMAPFDRLLRSGASFPWSAIAAMLVVLATIPTPIVARTFHCEDVWPQNSTRNQAEDCINNVSHISGLMAENDHVGWVVMMGFVAVLAIIAWIGCPIFVVGRYCCNLCGSRHRRPGHCCCGGEEWDSATDDEKSAAYSGLCLLVLKILALVLLLGGIIFMILIISGAAVAVDTYDETYDQIFGIVDYIDFQQQQLRNLLVRNDTGAYIRGITSDVFDQINDTKTTIRSQISGTKQTTDSYIEGFTIAAWVLSVVPVTLFAITVICALCHIRSLLPLINLGCHCFFVLPYAVFTIVFIIFAVAIGDVCGERNQYLENSDTPGLVSYGLQPTCNRYLPLDDVRQRINRAFVQNAQEACQQMLNICDGSSSYSTSDPQRVYYCQELARVGSSSCTSFGRARELIDAASLKGDNTATQCRKTANDPSTAYAASDCTIPACANDCTNDYVRAQSQGITLSLSFADSAEYAYRTYGEPWLNCGFLLRQALLPLGACDDVTSGMTAVAVGFFCATILLFVGMFVVVLGMKRFFKRTHHVSSPNKHTHVVQTREPVHTVQTNQPAHTVQATQPVHTVQTTQPVHTGHTTQPVHTREPVHTV